jgi:type VI protein secretion system component VasK
MILAAETLTNVVVTGVFMIVVAAIGYFGNRATKRDVQALHAEVKTNHGLRQGEYVELAAASAGKAALEASLARAMVEELGRQFNSHAQQDEANFNEIRELVTAGGDTSASS